MGGLYRGFTISAVGIFIYRGMYFGLYDTLKPLVLGSDAGVTLSFFLGWAVTVTAGLMSYPIDTVRRRMMMTSGGGVKYKGSILLHPSHEERGLHVLDEGCWSQHPPWSRRRRCARWLRQVPGHVHRLEDRPGLRRLQQR